MKEIDATEKVEQLMKGEGYKFLWGDYDFLCYGGKFSKTSDNECYRIIEIINEHEVFSTPKHDYLVSISTVCIDDDRLKDALETGGFNRRNYKRVTKEMKAEALHSYHGGDLITSIEGNDIIKMLKWIIEAERSYPYIQEYEEE